MFLGGAAFCSTGIAAFKSELRPDGRQRLNQVFDILNAMQRARGNPQALGPLWHRRIVNRLHIDPAVVEQFIRNPLAHDRIADDDGDDMRRVIVVRNTGSIEMSAQ